jgi:hypothetical protein
MLNKIKLWLGLQSYPQYYARTCGFAIVKTRKGEVALYRGFEIAGVFCSELEASTEVSRLDAWSKQQTLKKI